MSSRSIKIIATAGIVALAVALIFFIRGCGKGEKSSTDTVLTPEQSAHRILQEPAVFDERSLAEFAENISSNRSFTVEDISLMIVAAEATLNKFGQELEYLAGNEDAADSWETMTEEGRQTWPADFITIITFLQDSAPLNNEQVSRMQTLFESARRYQSIIDDIEKNQLKGKSTGLRIIP